MENKLAFGCSHTIGIGVEPNEAWPALLSAKNYGCTGVSADYVVRTAIPLIKEFNPLVVYVLWPDWSRFEYVQDGKILQSLSNDSNRIELMESHSDFWCLENFNRQTTTLRQFCSENKTKLVDITLYNLIPHIDHADRWPLSKLGHHYSPIWHQWVADIFRDAEETNKIYELRND